MAESSCLGGHGTYLVFFRCRNQAINSQNFSDRQTLMMCAHSFSPNSLSNFCCLCFYSSLLCVCIFLICCHSVFVWNPVSSTWLSMLVLNKPACWPEWVGVLVCVLPSCLLTFTFTRGICRGWTETHTLTSKEAGRKWNVWGKNFRRMEPINFLPLRAGYLPCKRIQSNGWECRAAVNRKANLSHP